MKLINVDNIKVQNELRKNSDAYTYYFVLTVSHQDYTYYGIGTSFSEALQKIWKQMKIIVAQSPYS